MIKDICYSLYDCQHFVTLHYANTTSTPLDYIHTPPQLFTRTFDNDENGIPSNRGQQLAEHTLR